jgi:hypothetical protein
MGYNLILAANMLTLKACFSPYMFKPWKSTAFGATRNAAKSMEKQFLQTGIIDSEMNLKIVNYIFHFEGNFGFNKN